MTFDPTKSNPFNKLNPKSGDKLSDEFDCRWEHARVNFMIGRLKLSKLKKPIMKYSHDNGYQGYLSFELFSQLFTNFPLQLAADRLADIGVPLHQTQKAFHPNWFKNFKGLPFMRPYARFVEKLGDQARVKPVGIVFPRKGFAQGMVAHNGELDMFLSDSASCHICRISSEPRTTIVVQPFAALLDHIRDGQQWVPQCEI